MSTREDRKERVEHYRKTYDVRDLAEMLVDLEDQYEKLRAKRRPHIQIGDNNTMVVRTRSKP